MSADQIRTQAAAAICAQAGDLRSGHDGPTGWLVAELDVARTQLRTQRTAVIDACEQIELALVRLGEPGVGFTARLAGNRIGQMVADLREAVGAGEHPLAREGRAHDREVATGGRREAGPSLVGAHDDGLLDRDGA